MNWGVTETYIHTNRHTHTQRRSVMKTSEDRDGLPENDTGKDLDPEITIYYICM